MAQQGSFHDQLYEVGRLDRPQPRTPLKSIASAILLMLVAAAVVLALLASSH